VVIIDEQVRKKYCGDYRQDVRRNQARPMLARRQHADQINSGALLQRFSAETWPNQQNHTQRLQAGDATTSRLKRRRFSSRINGFESAHGW